MRGGEEKREMKEKGEKRIEEAGWIVREREMRYYLNLYFKKFLNFLKIYY